MCKENNSLRIRENKLRRTAKEKGLFIKKRKWRLYYSQYSYESYDGYCIGTEENGLIIWGENENGMFSPTLDEAEEIVFNY
jgi:transposase